MNDTKNESVGEPGPTRSVPRESIPSTRQRRSERTHHTTSRRRSQRLILAIALAATVVVLFAVSLFSIIRIAGLASRNDSLKEELFQIKQQLANTDPSRPPYLKDFAPDNVISLAGGFVKNIVFSVLHQNGEIRLDYRLTVENKSERTLRPDVRVFIFDRKGMPIGVGDVTDHTDIGAGESHAFTSVIEKFIDEEPRYFYVWTRDQPKLAATSK